VSGKHIYTAIHTADADLTHTHSALADSRSCGIRCASLSLVNASLHPWINFTLSRCRQDTG